jgi:hypothetical protein
MNIKHRKLKITSTILQITENMKMKHKTVLLLLSTLLAIGIFIIISISPTTANATGFDQNEYFSVAPISIPIEDPDDSNSDGIGTADVGMTRFRWRAVSGTTAMKYVTVKLIYDGVFDRTDVKEIKIYFEDNQNGLFDRGGGDDTNVTVGGPYSFDEGDDDKKIEIDDSVAVKGTTGGWAIIWVAFDLKPGTNVAGTKIGCEILEVEDNTGGTFTPNPQLTDKEDVDDYEATITATGKAPPTGEQGEDDVPVLQLQFSANDTSMDILDTYKNVNLDAITVHLTGTDYADIDPGGFSLYDDANNNGIIDGGETSIPSTVIPMTPSEYVTINPSADIPFDETQISLIVTVNVAEAAGVGNTIGLEIEDPSSDIAFTDIINDIDVLNPAVYAYVSVGYVQEGYIAATGSTPGTGNTFTVTPLPDTDPPQVAATVPRNNESGVFVTMDVTIIFNEDINPSTVSGTNFYVEDSTGAPVSGTVSASGSEAVFTPDSNFNYEEIYTATLEPGVEDIYGNPMISTTTWSFVTTANVARPVAANNRILPGSTDPVQIHIPEPAGGPSEKITVQVFTTTGKKVATLINNRPYSQVESQLPLLWYGKNSRQKDLGPGLYFIQVITGNDKTILKVLIVR